MSGLCNEKLIYGNLVNGQWVESASGNVITVTSPVDGSFIGGIQAISKEEVSEVIRHSKEGLPLWASVPIYEKARILYKAAELLEERAEEISDILMMEIAKDKKSSLSEVKRTADFLRFTADAGKSLEGTAVSGENFPGGSRNKMSYVKRIPLGTVLAISPFNYPINLSASKIAPALIGGNTVILKPATQGAISALHLVKALQDAGLPDGVLQSVTGKGSEIGDYIVTHDTDDGSYNKEDGTTVGIDVLEGYLKESGASLDNELAFYCGTGWRATVPFLICYENGNTNAKLYDGGWFQWQMDDSLPVQVGDPENGKCEYTTVGNLTKDKAKK